MVATSKNSKKRPASSQEGPKTKKVKSGGQPQAVQDKGKKRSRPITQPVKEDSEQSSDGEEVLSHEGEDEEAEFEDGGEQLDEGGDVPMKDPNAARESHKAQRALFEQRRAAKPHSALLSEAKAAWTLARQKNLSRDERKKHIQALMDVVRGKVKDIVFKHDASRIVQTIVKWGGQAERNVVAEELKGRYLDAARNKYSKFLVTKLIRFCPAHRADILREFQGHVLRLLLHREASSVLADAFELHANAYERALLLRDFYGKEASLFSVTVTVGSEEERERTKLGLRGVLEGVEGERKRRVLNAVKENLVTIFNNPDKGAVSHAIVHRALWEYLSAVNDLESEEEQERLRREIFESCQDALAEMVHTKDGSRAVREFISQGTAKDRKHIVKAIKPHVERMCTDDEAQIALFTALDVIDDTKLTSKSLVSEIAAAASALYTSSQGRRSLIYLVAPRTRRHFTPAQIALMAETDAVRSRTSKKDSAVRTEEIRRAASDSLLAWVAEKGAEVSRDTGGSLLICEIMLYAEGDKSAASDTLLKALSSPYPSSDPDLPHPCSLPHTSRIYKTLLQGGHFSHSTKSVERSPYFSASDFATRFVQMVGRDVTVAIAQADGAFIVAALCERLAEEGSKEEKETVKSWFGKAERKKITGKGSAMLLEKLEVL
ncbi:ARM repeat-containing protein [Obba rivulosa]|uniref:ARM repeat-containing protein n=1 Tax=Obba rivulosa TaxID=1052685 RepID=A0A8E2AQN5_9APHY|nr:ARM repeat-containing protein [Obba rivulosa]